MLPVPFRHLLGVHSVGSMLSLENESGKHVVRREKFKSWPKMFQTCQFGSLAQLSTWAEPYFTLFITSKSVGVRFLDQKP